MVTSPAWQEQGPGKITISQGGYGAARLFGLPFLAVGGYFLYQLVSGAAGGDLTIPGWIALPLMTAVFLVPGWILVTIRRRLAVDAARRTATKELDFLVFTRRKTTAVPPGAHVMLRFERMTSRTTHGPVFNTETTTFAVHVYLVSNESPNLLVALFAEKDKPAALDFAGRLASFLQIDVQDHCVDGGEINAAGVVVDTLGPDEAD